MRIVRLPVVSSSAPPAAPPGVTALRAAARVPIPPVPVPVPSDEIVDPSGRRITYLRVSLTDRCNYRCAYCLPDDVTFRPRADLLTFEEIVRIVGVFAGLGVRRVRLTGGEPTVRKGVVDLVAAVAALPGIDEVVMTSNGHLLPELAAPLAAAGLRAVNVSLDTLDAGRFRRLTGRGELGRVVDGIDAARAAGLEVKLNAVALADVNGGELADLCAFAWERGTVTRFIEHMPMSGGRLYEAARELPAAAIRAAIEAAHGPLAPSAPAGPHRGPSRYWRLAADPRREVGIISAMTEHFCDACNRVRITATGELHACLGHDDAVSLRDVLRAGPGLDHDDALRAAIGLAVVGKRAGHEFQRSGDGGPTKHMISMGG